MCEWRVQNVDFVPHWNANDLKSRWQNILMDWKQNKINGFSIENQQQVLLVEQDAGFYKTERSWMSLLDSRNFIQSCFVFVFLDVAHNMAHIVVFLQRNTTICAIFAVVLLLVIVLADPSYVL